MLISFEKHIINESKTIKEALSQLNELAIDAILFVTNNDNQILGSLTDGDIRRGLIKNLTLSDQVIHFIQTNPKYIVKNNKWINLFVLFRRRPNSMKSMKINVSHDAHNVSAIYINLCKFMLQVMNPRTPRSVIAGSSGRCCGRSKKITWTFWDGPKPCIFIKC